MAKTIYCTLDTETYGGASHPKGIYHLGGIIHDREGNIISTFNYLISENYHEISLDNYAKKNFDRYVTMVNRGIVTMVSTEQGGIDAVKNLLDYYNVRYLMAFNSGFDFGKTKCYQLLEGREFIDLWLMALQTLAIRKKYADFCRANNLRSSSKKSVSTSAEAFYSYLTGNPAYVEEHTAWEDARIELDIFLACLKAHKKFTKNCHCFDYDGGWALFPKWATA